MIIEYPDTIEHFKSLLNQPHEHLNAVLVGSFGTFSEQLFIPGTRLSAWSFTGTIHCCVWRKVINFPEGCPKNAHYLLDLDYNRVELISSRNFSCDEWFALLAEKNPEMCQFLLFNLDLFL